MSSVFSLCMCVCLFAYSVVFRFLMADSMKLHSFGPFFVVVVAAACVNSHSNRNKNEWRRIFADSILVYAELIGTF